MDWVIIDLLGLVIAPAAFIWGWVIYAKTPNLPAWRMRASLFGLLTPILSILAWGVALAVANLHGYTTSDPKMQKLGTLIPIVGIFVGWFGRPKIAIAISLAGIGAVLFWFATTLP